ncbi:MAG TPA: GFA family protein [Novosphingobium sp.]|nr:GFA family protein [Novosphingobium sp.]
MKRIERSVSGGCQCGAVRYRASAVLDNAHLCHCRMCQKAVGNLFAALVAAPNDAIEWTRGAPALWRSSDHVERGFCAACGTPLLVRDDDSSRTNFTIGSLDRPSEFPPQSQMGSESRMPWFSYLGGLPDEGETGSGDEQEWAAAIAASNRQHPDHD